MPALKPYFEILIYQKSTIMCFILWPALLVWDCRLAPDFEPSREGCGHIGNDVHRRIHYYHLDTFRLEIIRQ